MGKIQLGLIGVGGMAQAHIKQILATGRAEIIAISDVSEDALYQVGEQLSIPDGRRYVDFVQLIRDSGVEAVVSVTPNHVHADVIKACLEAQKPFMSEKPFTRTWPEAVELVELYQQKPVPCMIGFSYRYIPAFRFAKALIDAGKLGSIHHISGQYLQGWGAAHYNMPFVWRFDKDVTGTGTLGDLGSHMIDLARYLVGEFEDLTAQLHTIVPERNHPTTGEPRPVQVDDFASFQARLTNDVMGVFQSTRNAIGSGNQHEVSVYGATATLHASTLTPDEVTFIYEDEDTGELVKKIMQVPGSYKVSQWSDFFTMLQGQATDGLPGFMDGYRNQVVLEAVVQSSLSNRRVSIHEINGAIL